jgi:hypothetical protein
MELLKSRVLKFAGTVEADYFVITFRIFGSEEFFKSKEKITAQQLIDLAVMHPKLNMNWILTGSGNMIFPTEQILIQDLVRNLEEIQKEMDKLKLQLKGISRY